MMKDINSQGKNVNGLFSSFRKRALINLAKAVIAILDTPYVPISIKGTTSIFAIIRYPLLLRMLVKTGSSATTQLEDALDHPNLNVRLSAISAIGQSGHPSAVDLLLPFLDSGEAAEREWAVSALGFTHSPLVFERIIAALEDEHLGVRESAIRALGDFGNENALLKLEQLAADKTLVESYGLTIGHVAKEAIEKIQKRGKK
jgi:HEAT repeat protein